MENPPEEKGTATSGLIPVVPPTEVTLYRRVSPLLLDVYRTHYGQVLGKVGLNGPPSHASFGCPPETPPSPDENITLAPRAASCSYCSQSGLPKDGSYQLTLTMNENIARLY